MSAPRNAGANVERFQKMLSEAGFAIAIDGIYGPETTRVVKAFQERAGLPVSGQPDAATVEALRARLSGAGRVLDPVSIKGHVAIYGGIAVAAFLAYHLLKKR